MIIYYFDKILSTQTALFKQKRHELMEIIKTDDFDVKYIHVGDIEEYPDSVVYHLKIKYNGNPLRIFTKPIKLIEGSRGTEIQLWLDNSEGGLDLINKVINPIDEFFNKKINKREGFLKFADDKIIKNLEYIKKAQTYSECKLDRRINVKLAIKQKNINNTIDLDNPNNETKEILTKIFLPSDITSITNITTPSNEKVFKSTPEQINSIVKFKSTLIAGCEVMLLLEVEKLIIQKMSDSKNGKKTCFLVIKCLQVYINSYDNMSKRIRNSTIPKCHNIIFEPVNKKLK